MQEGPVRQAGQGIVEHLILQCLLRKFAFSQVTHDSCEQTPAVQLYLAHGKEQRKLRPVYAPSYAFTTSSDHMGLAGRVITLQVMVMSMAVRFRHQDVDALTDQHINGIAE